MTPLVIKKPENSDLCKPDILNAAGYGKLPVPIDYTSISCLQIYIRRKNFPVLEHGGHRFLFKSAHQVFPDCTLSIKRP